MKLRELVPWRSGSSSMPVSVRDEFPFGLLHKDVDDLFEGFFSDFHRGLPYFSDSKKFIPKININDSDTEISVEMELPGMKQEDVDIEVKNNRLVVSGEKHIEKKDKKSSYYESSYGSFYRSIPLTEEIERENVKAKLKDGILTVTLPKTAKAQSEVRKIAIES